MPEKRSWDSLGRPQEVKARLRDEGRQTSEDMLQDGCPRPQNARSPSGLWCSGERFGNMIPEYASVSVLDRAVHRNCMYAVLHTHFTTMLCAF